MTVALSNSSLMKLKKRENGREGCRAFSWDGEGKEETLFRQQTQAAFEGGKVSLQSSASHTQTHTYRHPHTVLPCELKPSRLVHWQNQDSFLALSANLPSALQSAYSLLWPALYGSFGYLKKLKILHKKIDPEVYLVM